MMFKEGDLHYLRTFSDQLYDAVYLLYLAEDINQDNFRDGIAGSLTRSSIINSCILLESAANCALASIGINGPYFEDVERMQSIAKYEYFLHRVNPNAKFEKGCKELQHVKDLINIRNDYVHPKVKNNEYKKLNDLVLYTDYGQTDHLKFPRDPAEWRVDEAILALKTVNNFFNKYFLEWCGLSVDAVIDLLLSSDEVNLDQPIGAGIDCVGGLDRAVSKWGIDFKFIGKRIEFKEPQSIYVHGTLYPELTE